MTTQQDSPAVAAMTDEEIITEAESLGFKFNYEKGSFMWTVVAPDETVIRCEQGDPKGMQWLREKLSELKCRLTSTMTDEEYARNLTVIGGNSPFHKAGGLSTGIAYPCWMYDQRSGTVWRDHVTVATRFDTLVTVPCTVGVDAGVVRVMPHAYDCTHADRFIDRVVRRPAMLKVTYPVFAFSLDYLLDTVKKARNVKGCDCAEPIVPEEGKKEEAATASEQPQEVTYSLFDLRKAFFNFRGVLDDCDENRTGWSNLEDYLRDKHLDDPYALAYTMKDLEDAYYNYRRSTCEGSFSAPIISDNWGKIKAYLIKKAKKGTNSNVYTQEELERDLDAKPDAAAGSSQTIAPWN